MDFSPPPLKNQNPAGFTAERGFSFGDLKSDVSTLVPTRPRASKAIL
jgi:hypothetical protein